VKSGSSDTAELLKAQHRDLQATLAKRSDVNADRAAIVKEFAAARLAKSSLTKLVGEFEKERPSESLAVRL
jgi:hypothetical protein